MKNITEDQLPHYLVEEFATSLDKTIDWEYTEEIGVNGYQEGGHTNVSFESASKILVNLLNNPLVRRLVAKSMMKDRKETRGE